MKKIIFLLVTFFLIGVNNVFAETDVNDEASLKQALMNGETVINLENDITISNDVHTHATREVGLEVKGEGTITINGNGHKITSPLEVAIELRANSGKTVNIVFNDVTVIGAKRAIDIRSNNLTLNLNNTRLSLSSTGNYQALTIGGSAGRIAVNINNGSVIDGGTAGYGIIVFNPVDLTIKDSTVKGYAAIFMKESDGSEGSAGSIVNIENSLIEGNSKYSGASDNFGTIVMSDKKITINVKDSVIKAVNTGTAYQVPFVIDENLSGVAAEDKNAITVEGNTKIIIDTQINDESLVLNYDEEEIKVVVKAGVESNVEIPSEYLETGVETVVDSATGTVTVVKRYNIQLDTVKNGTVNIKENALANEEVEITTTPNKNYELQSVKVVDASGKDVEVIDNKFTMPESDVTVTVTFVSSEKVPQTSDNIGTTIFAGVVAMISAFGICLYLKKERFN